MAQSHKFCDMADENNDIDAALSSENAWCWRRLCGDAALGLV